MFNHITLGANDLPPMSAFYDAVLAPLGMRRFCGSDIGVGWRAEPGGPAFYVGTPFDQRPATAGNGVTVAFRAPSPEAVDAAGLAAGGTDEGPPGPRPQYQPGYYGAYLRDPEGNKVHVVHGGS